MLISSYIKRICTLQVYDVYDIYIYIYIYINIYKEYLYILYRSVFIYGKR